MTMIIRPTPGVLAALLFTAAMPTAAPAAALPTPRQGIHAIGSRNGSVCLPARGHQRGARSVAGCPTAAAVGKARLQWEPGEFPLALLGWALSGFPGPP